MQIGLSAIGRSSFSGLLPLNVEIVSFHSGTEYKAGQRTDTEVSRLSDLLRHQVPCLMGKREPSEYLEQVFTFFSGPDLGVVNSGSNLGSDGWDGPFLWQHSPG